MRRSLIIWLIIVLGITACTPQPPSSEEIKIQVAKEVLSNGKDKIFIFDNFHKTNGLMQQDGSYIAEVSYDLVFRNGLLELKQSMTTTQSPLVALGAGIEMMTQLLQYGQFKAGDKLTVNAKFKFIKTEQGWRLASDFNL
jgi:hypothetical protein